MESEWEVVDIFTRRSGTVNQRSFSSLTPLYHFQLIRACPGPTPPGSVSVRMQNLPGLVSRCGNIMCTLSSRGQGTCDRRLLRAFIEIYVWCKHIYGQVTGYDSVSENVSRPQHPAEVVSARLHRRP